MLHSYFIPWLSDFEMLFDCVIRWILILEHQLFKGPMDLDFYIFRFVKRLYTYTFTCIDVYLYLNSWFVEGYLSKAQKSHTKLEMNSIIESWNDSGSRFWFFSRELIWITVLEAFELWVDWNKISKTHFEAWVDSNQVLLSHCGSWVESNLTFLRPSWIE